MTITWRGLGFLGFMIPLAIWGLSAVLFGSLNFKAFRIAFVIAAVIVWLVGTRVNGGELADDEKAPHLALGLPLQLTGVLLCGAGFLLTLL